MRSFILFLLLGLGAANAQGVNERMVTGAPPVYTYPAPSEPSRSTAVPTGPRAQAYPPVSPYLYPRYRYGNRILRRHR